MPKQKNGKQPAKSTPRKRKPQRSPRPPMGRAVAAPAAMSSRAGTQAARISRGHKSIRIQHSELVTTINDVGDSVFRANPLSINPGIDQLFPWLSVMAKDWEQYTFHKLKFNFITRCPTITAGSLLFAPDYDVLDRDFTDLTEAAMSTFQDCVEDVPWKNNSCVLDPRAMHPDGPRKYIRDARTAGDLKTYDVGQFIIGNTNTSGGASLGKLWVEYDVEFFVPQTSGVVRPVSTTLFHFPGGQVYPTGVATVNTGDSVVYDPLHIGLSSAGVFSPPKGAYRIDFEATFQDTTGNALLQAQFIRIDPISGPGGVSCIATSSIATTGPGIYGRLSLSSVASFEANQTFEVLVTLTSAAGVLTRLPATSCLIWTPA